MYDIETYIALESINCESLFDDIIEPAEEGLADSIKLGFTKLKEWFVKICKAFWAKVKEIYHAIRKKLNKDYKSPDEKYKDLMEAYKSLQEESKGKDKELKRKDRTIEDERSESADLKKENAKLTDLNTKNNAEKDAIISEMQKNNSTLEQEKAKIEKDYNTINGAIKDARDRLDGVFQLLWDAVSDLYNQKVYVLKDGDIDIETVNHFSDDIHKNIGKIESILKEVTRSYENSDITSVYFKGGLRSLKYWGQDEKKGSALKLNLNKVEDIQSDLTRALDKKRLSGENETAKEEYNAILKIATDCHSVMNLITKCMEF